MKRISFTKLSGAGNDFLLFESKKLPKGARAALARRLCLRRQSIGADGLLIITRNGRRKLPELDYYNADGSRAFCGNGSRCAAWWMYRQGWVGKTFTFDSIAGPIDAIIESKELVRIHMPNAYGLKRYLRLKAVGKTYRVCAINTGVPHALIRVKGLKRFPVFKVGRALRHHPAFKPKGTNVNFIEIDGPKTLVRTYERGVEDETLACGTGVVASAIATYLWTGKKPPVRVVARGGRLKVDFKTTPNGCFKDVWLEGAARITYHGEVRQ